MAGEARAEAVFPVADTDGAGEIVFSKPACRAGGAEEWGAGSFVRMDTKAMRQIIPEPRALETNSIISGRKPSLSEKGLNRYRAGSANSNLKLRRKRTKG